MLKLTYAAFMTEHYNNDVQENSLELIQKKLTKSNLKLYLHSLKKEVK